MYYGPRFLSLSVIALPSVRRAHNRQSLSPGVSHCVSSHPPQGTGLFSVFGNQFGGWLWPLGMKWLQTCVCRFLCGHLVTANACLPCHVGHLFNSLRNQQPSAPPVAGAEGSSLATRSPVLGLSLRGVLSGTGSGRLAPVPQQHRSDFSDHVCSLRMIKASVSFVLAPRSTSHERNDRRAHGDQGFGTASPHKPVPAGQCVSACSPHAGSKSSPCRLWDTCQEWRAEREDCQRKGKCKRSSKAVMFEVKSP